MEINTVHSELVSGSQIYEKLKRVQLDNEKGFTEKQLCHSMFAKVCHPELDSGSHKKSKCQLVLKFANGVRQWRIF